MGRLPSQSDTQAEQVLVNATGLTNGVDAFSTDVTGKTGGLIRAVVNLNTTATVTITETFGGVTVNNVLNKGATITAGDARAFDIPAISGATYNLQVGTTQTASAWKRHLFLVKP